MSDSPVGAAPGGLIAGPGDLTPARARGRIPRPSAGRAAALLAGVWIVTVAAYFAHLIAIPAALWFAAAVAFLPLGRSITDRIVAIVVGASAYLALVGWVSPHVPVLINPILLTGLLGSIPAVVWGLGKSRLPFVRAADYVSLSVGAAAGLLWFRPMASLDPVRIVAQMYFGPDNAAHYGMWRGVWAEHGYEIAVSHVPHDAYIWTSYPQGAHVILSALGSVFTSSTEPPVSVAGALRLFALLVSIQVGAMALVMSWAVDRLTRIAIGSRRLIRGIWQVVPAIVVVIGPGAFIFMSSVSFVTGFILMIPAAIYATTYARWPRRAALLTATALAGAVACYPVMAVFAPAAWLICLWMSRTYWLRHKLLAGAVTVVAAVVSVPMVLMLILRDVPHGWDVGGVFEPVPIFLFVATAAALGCIMIVGNRWFPKPLTALAWLAGVVSFALVVVTIVQWYRLGKVEYYSVKSLYATWVLTVLVICGAVACLMAGWHPADESVRQRRRLKVVSMVSGLALIVTAAFAGMLLKTADVSPLPGIWRVIPGGQWIAGAPGQGLYGMGSRILQFTEFSYRSGRIPVTIPCDLATDKWLSFLGGGMSETEVIVYQSSCDLSGFVAVLREYPQIKVDAFVTDVPAREDLLDLKHKYNLDNLTVIGVEPKK